MKCSHAGHTLPHRLLLILKPPLQCPRGIIASTHNLGGLSTPREDYHQASHNPGGLSPRERGLSPLTILADYHSLERIITSPLCRFRAVTLICREKWLLSTFGVLHPLPFFPHNNSGLVTCYYLRGYGLRALIIIFNFSSQGSHLNYIFLSIVFFMKHKC